MMMPEMVFSYPQLLAFFVVLLCYLLIFLLFICPQRFVEVN